MSTCTDYADDLYSAYEYAESRFGYFQSNYAQLTESLHNTDLGLFITRLKNCLINDHIALQAITFGNTGYTDPKRVPYMFLNCTGGDVDMDMILTAMLSAKFAQLEKFIGLIDAYRLAIWNAPFNAEFYASLARGFQKWP